MTKWRILSYWRKVEYSLDWCPWKRKKWTTIVVTTTIATTCNSRRDTYDCSFCYQQPRLGFNPNRKQSILSSCSSFSSILHAPNGSGEVSVSLSRQFELRISLWCVVHDWSQGWCFYFSKRFFLRGCCSKNAFCSPSFLFGARSPCHYHSHGV